MVAALPDLLLETSLAEARILYVSPRSRDVLGYTPEELVGLPLFELFHSDDVEAGRRQRELLAGGTRPVSCRCRLRTRSGDWIWMEALLGILRHPNGRETVIACCRDVTDWVRSEQQQTVLQLTLEKVAEEWNRTFDAMDFPVFVLDEQHMILRLNQAAAREAGLSFRDALGQPLGRLGEGQPWKAATEVAERVLEAGGAEPVEVAEVDGGRFWAVSASAAVTPDGGWVILALHDVTEPVKLKRSLVRSEAMAALGSLLGSVAHEARNPLFGITALVDALQLKARHRPELAELLGALARDVQRLTQLMANLLDYGRPTHAEPIVQDMASVVDEAIGLSMPTAVEKEVAVARVHRPGSFPVSVDRARMVRALTNVLLNALHYSDAGGEVLVDLADQPDRGRILCSVLDRGPGFSSTDLDRVTEPFYSRRPGGTGLGMAIVERIIGQHGGRLRLANRPGGGARVELELPRHRASPTDGPESSPNPQEVSK